MSLRSLIEEFRYHAQIDRCADFATTRSCAVKKEQRNRMRLLAEGGASQHRLILKQILDLLDAALDEGTESEQIEFFDKVERHARSLRGEVLGRRGRP